MKDELKFIRRLREGGVRGRVVSIEHLKDLESEIEAFHDGGLLFDGVYSDYGKTYFHPSLPSNFPDARSIIVLSIPQPKLIATFHWRGKELHYVVPPTYYDYNRNHRHARHLLDRAFRPGSHRFVRAALPVKLLATRSGLALYGRNNITYVPEHGSFHRLMAFYSDYESPLDQWQEKEALPLCSKCRACMKACPTKAIRGDEFVIDAGKCIPYHNEKSADLGFPKWLDPSAHNCLVGCLTCQKVCPYDKGVFDWHEERGWFSEEETGYLLRGEFSGEKAKRMERRLKRIGVDLSIFPRNLEALIQRD